MEAVRHPTASSSSPSRTADAPAARPSAAGLALLAMLLIYFLAYFQRAAVPGTIFDDLQRDLALTAAAVTGLGAMFYYIYAGMQLAVGFATDRYGGARTLLFGGVFLTIGALLFPFAHSPGLAYASRALTGFGSSFVYLSLVREVDRLFGPRHFAAIVGVVTACGYAGGVAAMLPFERAAAAFGWRHALLGIGGLTLLAMVVAWWRLHRQAAAHVPGDRFAWGAFLGILLNRRGRSMLVISAINFPIYFVIQTVLGKKFLQDFAGLSSPAAATFTLVMMIVAMTAALGGGLFLRLVGDRRKPAMYIGASCLLVAFSLLLAGVQWRLPGWVFLVGYVLAAMQSLATPATIATMKEVNRRDVTALAIAVLNCVAYLGVAVLANVAGLILDVVGGHPQPAAGVTVYPPGAYAAVFALLCGLSLLSLVVTWHVPETREAAVGPDPVGVDL